MVTTQPVGSTSKLGELRAEARSPSCSHSHVAPLGSGTFHVSVRRYQCRPPSGVCWYRLTDDQPPSIWGDRGGVVRAGLPWRIAILALDRPGQAYGVEHADMRKCGPLL